MSKITAGPIIGHTSSTMTHIWVLTDSMVALKLNLKYWPKGTPASSIKEVKDLKAVTIETKYDTANKKEFKICVIELNDLQIDTSYEGYCYLDGYKINQKILSFKTFPDTQADISFVLGSCRKKGDLSMETIEKKKAALKPDFVLMMGDQVYCDHERGWFTPFDEEITSEDFFKDYTYNYNDWGRDEGFQTVTSTIPSYMIYDDHEILNDWGKYKVNYFKQFGDTEEYRDFAKYVDTYEAGLKYYQAFQSCFNPSLKSSAIAAEEYVAANSDSVPDQYYDFSCASNDFFVMDVRGEREAVITEVKRGKSGYPDCKPADLRSNKMIGDSQKQALKSWLLEPGTVKFIVSPVPIFPDVQTSFFEAGFIKGTATDVWTYFSHQRKEILDMIVELNSQKKVIFLSGDVHCSFVTKMEYKNVTFHSVISSAFSWNYPGLRKSDFEWDELKDASGATLELLEDKCETHDNFLHVKVSDANVDVTCYKSRNGKKSFQVTI